MNIPPVQKRAAPRGLSISERRGWLAEQEQLRSVFGDDGDNDFSVWPWDYFYDVEDAVGDLVLTVGPEKVRVWSTDDYATVWGVLAGNADEQDVDVWYDGVRWDGTRTEVQTRPWTLGEAARWA